MSEVIRICNIDLYSIEIVDGTLLATPKEPKQYITTDDFNKCILTSSKIISCIITHGDKIISNKRKYMSILVDIWKTMTTTKIVQNTTFNMKTNEQYENGYKWRPELMLSVQGKDAKQTMNEIIHMIVLNKYSIDISIELQTGKCIHYKV